MGSCNRCSLNEYVTNLNKLLNHYSEEHLDPAKFIAKNKTLVFLN